MKVIYIAGPYRDLRGAFYIGRNIQKAEEMALWVWQHRGVAICPHKNTAFFDGAYGIPDQTWLDGDLELVKRSDAVFAISGWETSKGAMGEVQYARSLGIPVLLNAHEVALFLGAAA